MSLILSETRERLLKAIIAQVPPERIAEIHFFSPIKQGGVESGVAVVAAVPEPVPVVESERPATGEDSADVASIDAEAASDDSVDAEAEVASENTTEAAAEETVEEHAGSDVDVAAGDEDVGTPDTPAPDASSKRHVIYTARYRYTLKGPDRGKWETNVKAEADAPLITVDTVVRGVQRRAGDVDEPERVSGDEIRTVTNAWAAAALPGGVPAPR